MADFDSKRFRLSVDIEIIETQNLSGIVHTHSRSLEVREYPSLDDARSEASRLRSLVTPSEVRVLDGASANNKSA